MKEKIGDFLMDISQTYPVVRGVNAEKVIEDARTYLVGKLYNKEIDFQKAKTMMFDTYDKRTFPEPKVLYNILYQCEVKNYDVSANEGSLVVITLPDGRKYNFTVSGIGRPLSTIKDEILKKYGGCEVKTYPKSTVMIGNKIFEP